MSMVAGNLPNISAEPGAAVMGTQDNIAGSAIETSGNANWNPNTGLWNRQADMKQMGASGAMVTEPTVEALLRDESIGVRAVVIAMANLAGMDPVQLYQAAQAWQNPTI